MKFYFALKLTAGLVSLSFARVYFKKAFQQIIFHLLTRKSEITLRFLKDLLTKNYRLLNFSFI